MTENKFILGDCMDPETGLPSYPDNYFDLAICDPPYGGGQELNFRFENGIYQNKKPTSQYFIEIKRVSKNLIVWGGNYFTDYLPPSRGWICWQKGNPLDQFSDFELAWTSFDKISLNVKLDSYGFNHADKRLGLENTIHPTQKPVALYRWLLQNYAQPGDLILDTHVGSASSLIACESMDFNYHAWEIDPDYYAAAKKRMAKGIQKVLL